METASSVPSEFWAATPVAKFKRYAFGTGTDGSSATYFGLLGVDGEVRYFRINPDATGPLALEFSNLARMAKFLARGGRPDDFLATTVAAPTVGADGLVPPFMGPAMKFHRAQALTDELEDQIQQYADQVTVTATKIGEDSDDVIWRLGFSQQAPAWIPLLVGDIVHNLRSALDIMICDIARVRHVSTSDLKLPFAEDRAKLEKHLKLHRTRLGDDVADEILGLKPYIADGDPLLRGLHDLDIIDKHKLVLASVGARWYRYDIGAALGRSDIVALGDMWDSYFHDGEVIRRKAGEDPLALFGPHDRGVEVMFARDVPTFGGQSILEVVAKLLDLTATIIDRFSGKFGAGGGNVEGAPIDVQPVV